MAAVDRMREEALVIEEAKAADLAVVSDLDTKITGITKPEFWAEIASDRGAKGRRSVLVARLNGLIVGYVVGEIRSWEFGSPPCGWLHTIGVRPDYRLSHIGSALCDALQARFRAAGVGTMRTMLHIDDHLLLSFFRSQGLTAGPFLELEMGLD